MIHLPSKSPAHEHIKTLGNILDLSHGTPPLFLETLRLISMKNAVSPSLRVRKILKSLSIAKKSKCKVFSETQGKFLDMSL